MNVFIRAMVRIFSLGYRLAYRMEHFIFNRMKIVLTLCHTFMTEVLSGAEQFAISLRWVDPEYNIFEDFIRMVDVESTTAEQLTFFH